ncbi:unnamed protein product [Dicrocoelium dendriticum]|nr:unnamed protein product [Dicrocoelium dendriticum]
MANWLDGDAYYRINFVSGSADDYEAYKGREIYATTQKRRQFEEDLATSAKTAPNELFTCMKRRLRPTSDVAVLVSIDGQPLTSSTERASVLADHFASVFTSGYAPMPSLTFAAPTQLEGLGCGEDVRSLFTSLDGTKPVGPVGLHPLMLKFLSVIISSAVTDLSNRSLSEGALPSDWKCPVVKPILEGGDLRNMDNYRPIYLISVLGKLLEKIVK